MARLTLRCQRIALTLFKLLMGVGQVITDRFALANGDHDTCNEGNCE
jgi:hypothetical protein